MYGKKKKSLLITFSMAITYEGFLFLGSYATGPVKAKLWFTEKYLDSKVHTFYSNSKNLKKYITSMIESSTSCYFVGKSQYFNHFALTIKISYFGPNAND